MQSLCLRLELHNKSTTNRIEQVNCELYSCVLVLLHSTEIGNSGTRIYHACEYKIHPRT